MTFKKAFLAIAAACSLVLSADAQILLSGGLAYSQNFNSLSNTPAGTTYTWTDNATLGVEGWYASRSYSAGTTGPFGPFAYTGYRVGDGSANNGTLWSYGTIGAIDRALGSSSSGTPKTNTWGVRFQNDNPYAVDNILISYTGEQWRNGGNTAVQSLFFAYKTGASPVVSSPLDVSPNGVNGWIGFAGLNFNSPITGATAATLDGNLLANQTAFVNVLLTGVTLNPGDEIFLRWLDIDDSGNDHGLAIDNFSISFTQVPEPATAALFGLAAVGLVFFQRKRV
jgi:hypothetical protein